MSTRFLLTSTPPRMIISKQGFEASPDLDDDNKCFDSNWFGGNGIKWVLRKEQQFEPQDDKHDHKLLNMTIDFPYELNYQPACIAYHCLGQVVDNDSRIVVEPHYIVWNDNKSVTVRAPFGAGLGTAGTGRVTLFVVVFESRPTQVRTEKTTRIVIGANPYDGRKGLWITEPGCRAGDLKEPHVISSDNDYLKLHATGIVKPDEYGSPHNKFWTADFYFPALPYFPIVFIQLAANDADKRILFPFDNNANWNDVEGSDDIPGYSYIVYKDHIDLRTIPRNYSENFDIRYLVFKNKLC